MPAGDDPYAPFEHLAFDRPAPAVLRVTMNAPGSRGAMSAAVHRELSELWPIVSGDESVRSVLVTASGPDFAAGGDLKEQLASLDDHERQIRAMQEARELVHGMLDCPKPIVSAARGWAAGSGLALLVLADVSIASEDARLTDGHTKIGLAAGDHAAIIWPLLCGLAKTKYYLLTSEPLSGAEAERINLISRAVPDSELESESLAIAERLADAAPNAIRWTKQVINHWARSASPIFDASLALEMLGSTSPEGREGLEAFVEKRQPRWES